VNWSRSSFAGRVIDFFASKNQSAPRPAFPTLTEREREILQLLASRQRDTEIARELGLSQKTVSNYLSNIFGKLQVADRAEATLQAQEAGLGGSTR
jgi:DNA-binding NarL/FixJ family response regulator